MTTGATGTPMRKSDVPLDMDIITAAEISRSAARDIPDLLRQVRGVTVRRNGNGWADVSIRGYNQPMASRVLVLLNGRPVYEEDYGFVVWDAIPVQLSEIQQIEIVRGTNTALYGFNATSGVINIITKNPLYHTGGEVAGSLGIDGYRRGAATVGGKVSDSVGLQASLGGYEVKDDKVRGGGLTGTVPLDDPNTLVGRVDGVAQLGEGTQLSLSGSKSKVDESLYLYGGITNPFEMDENALQMNLSSDTQYGLIGFQVYHTNSEKLADVTVPSYDLAVTDAQLSDVFKLGADHTVRLQTGYRYVTSDIYPLSSAGDQLSYATPSVSGLWNWKLSDSVSWTNALRYDHFIMQREGTILLGSATISDYDRDTGDVSFNSGLVYQASPKDTWRVHVARGVDLPSITELATQLQVSGPVQLRGNPRLGISTTMDTGMSYERAIPEYDMKAIGSVFYQFNDDMPSSRQLSAGGGQFEEYIDSRMVGFELGLDGKIGEPWNWGVSYSFSNIMDDYRASNPVQRYQDTNSDHMVNAKLGYTSGNWSADTFLSYNSSFYTQNAPTFVDDVVQLDANVGYQLTPQWSLDLTVIGLTDATWNDTGTAALRNQRQAFLTSRYQF